MASRERPRSIVYVDGFNLYRRCLKGTRHKWLDLVKLSRFLVPNLEVVGVRYFTAVVESRSSDPRQQQRQQAYLRALRALPEITVHLGTFKTRTVMRPLAEQASSDRMTFVRVLQTEEKGSDVNLATYLLLDAFKDAYDVAVVVSNDSDLREPIRVVRTELQRPVGVVITDPRTRQSGLPADFHRRIREKQLRACHLPMKVEDDKGVVQKPRGW